MSYYCAECKLVINDEDVDIEENNVGVYMGRPAIETYPICPKCGEPVEEYYGVPADAEEYDNPLKDILEGVFE